MEKPKGATGTGKQLQQGVQNSKLEFTIRLLFGQLVSVT